MKSGSKPSNSLSGPRIRVKPPGPRTRALLNKSGDALAQLPPIWGIPVTRAEGPWIEDVDGNGYLDFISGKIVASIGHRHPEIVRVLKEQIGRVILGATENRFSLEEKLCELTRAAIRRKFFLALPARTAWMEPSSWPSGPPTGLIFSALPVPITGRPAGRSRQAPLSAVWCVVSIPRGSS
jgi:hypothetical protein